jgi:hypothetical protein
LNNPILLAAVAGVLGLTGSFAQAQVIPAPVDAGPAPAANKPKTADGKSADDWRFGFTSYAWLNGLAGNATARGNTVDYNASILDLFQKSSSLAAFDGYVEGKKGRFAFYGDLVWAKLGVPTSAASYANPIRGVTLSTQSNVASTTSLTILEGGAMYEVARWPATERSFTTLDAYAGLRYWNLSTQVYLDLTGTLDFSDPRLSRFDRSKTIGVADSGTLQWVDPLIGLRLRHQFTPSQEVMLRGDIGGFGISGSSTFSWQVAAVYSYTWQFDGYAIAAVGGYRALSTSISFDSGANVSGLNLVLHGPLVGFTVKF